MTDKAMFSLDPSKKFNLRVPIPIFDSFSLLLLLILIIIINSMLI